MMMHPADAMLLAAVRHRELVATAVAARAATRAGPSDRPTDCRVPPPAVAAAPARHRAPRRAVGHRTGRAARAARAAPRRLLRAHRVLRYRKPRQVD
jgi:hypothetical protein